MIDLRAPFALEVGDTVLMAWPDWYFRKATVVATKHFNLPSSKAPDEEEVWRISVRFQDGIDATMETAIYRGQSEMVPVVLKGQTENKQPRRQSPGTGRRAATASPSLTSSEWDSEASEEWQGTE